MKLILSELPESLRGPSDSSYKGHVPKRARLMHPSAAAALLALPFLGKLIFTDVFRSAEVSLMALRSKRGVKFPSYSGHNFGLSFDLDVHATLLALGKRYPDLIDMLGDHSFFCHRRDMDGSASESWHFNAILKKEYMDLALPHDRGSWDQPVEQVMWDLYGQDFSYDGHELQRKLVKLGLYHGEIDGSIGPLSQEAIMAFQRTWGLRPSGVAARTEQRLLAYVTAEVEVVPIPGAP